jgi:hypothetical protein
MSVKYMKTLLTGNIMFISYHLVSQGSALCAVHTMPLLFAEAKTQWTVYVANMCREVFIPLARLKILSV